MVKKKKDRIRKHNYLVGYRGENQVIYGDRKQDYRFTNPMTLPEAKQLSKKIFCQSGRKIVKSVVYKLVEVREEK